MWQDLKCFEQSVNPVNIINALVNSNLCTYLHGELQKMNSANKITLKRTTSDDPDFRELVVALDRHLHKVFGVQQEFYDTLNVIENCDTVVLAYCDGEPAGCGALRAYDEDKIEVKRMYAAEHYRGIGIATAVLHELEQWAKELGYKEIILETGILLAPANAFYKKEGYQVTDKWGQYVDAENSVCMKKTIR